MPPIPFGIAKKFAPDVVRRLHWPGKVLERRAKPGSIPSAAIRSPLPPTPSGPTCSQICNRVSRPQLGRGRPEQGRRHSSTPTTPSSSPSRRSTTTSIKAEKLDEDIKFNGKSEADNLWHEVWHHEGRIWRMGAFMQGQDWQHWEGSYEVADDGSHFADWLDKLRTRKAVKEKLGIE